MSLTKELIRKSIQSLDGSMLKDVVKIEHPEERYKNYVITEYDGDVPRLFGDKRSIEIMLPTNMDVVMENAVVDAIESGSIFDDKRDIENKVDYISMTHLPHTGMMHKHIDEPHELKHAIGAVIGAMNHEGRFGHEDSDMKNGKNYTMDLTSHGDDKDTAVMDLTNDYLDIKDKHGKGCPKELKRSLAKVTDEVAAIKEVKAEDTVDDDDYEEVDLKHETDDYDEPDEDESEKDESDDDDDDKPKSKSKKKDKDDEDDDDGEDEDHDKDGDKEKSIEKFLNKRKKDIDVDIEEDEDSDDDDDDEIDVEEEASVFSGWPKKSDPPQRVGYGQESSSYDSPVTNGRGGVVSTKTPPASSVHPPTSPMNNSSFSQNNIASATSKGKSIANQLKSESYRYEYDEYEMYQESHAMLVKPKKLKPIPRDVVAYIITQTNAIRDTNDQAMISGYCCSKLELVDFYLNCLDVHDYRYIVPHNRQYLIQMQNDLNRCLQNILRIKPVNRLDRVWRVNVNYPDGWGG